MVTCFQIPVPTTGTANVVSGAAINSSNISIRNTGTVTVLLGTASSALYPLEAGEALGLSVAPEDVIVATLPSGSASAGQLTILGVG